MAIVTGIPACYVVCTLASRRHAVVARSAGAQNLRMINGVRRHPDIGIMAILADVAGLNMGWCLAGCVSAIVAGDAIGSNIRMVEVGRQPTDR